MINKNIVKKKFIEFFGDSPLLVYSPGRVNLIGEHTDYNDGFVLPAAIDKKIIFAVSVRKDDLVHLYSLDMDDHLEFRLNKYEKSNSKLWTNYLLGAIDQLIKNGYDIKGFNCVFGGDIPMGAGLSSSAAIETGLIFALNELFNLNIDKLTMIRLAQKAENEFVGVQCGIMDQFINIYGKKNMVLKLDCRSLEYEYFPFENDKLQIVLCNTMVKHSLFASEYNVRRKQCEEGVLILKQFNHKINSLRDVSIEFLNQHKSDMNELIYKRCKYVVEENKRVNQACEDLHKNDFVSFGKKMYQTHLGLKIEFEVSCYELDTLIELAANQDYVLGARMLGGGFGGCTINIIMSEKVEDFKKEVRENFKKIFGIFPEFYVCRIGDGTHLIK